MVRRMREFEFSAFLGSDLLADGDQTISVDDVLIMPLSATSSFAVVDNDKTLSGDAWRDEVGDDRRGQKADIIVDGETVAENSKIYAEQYHILQDGSGNTYYLIEIEVARTDTTDSEDYFTFLGDVPAAQSELTVVKSGNVFGNWVSYKDLGAGLIWTPDDNGSFTIEAENMALTKYRIDDVDAASGGEVIKLKSGEGEAALVFGAESGTYDLQIAYVDESDGQGAIEVLVDGALVETINLTEDTDGARGDGLGISTRTISGLTLNTGSEIVLRGRRDETEFARIDALTFTPVLSAPLIAADDSVTVAEDTTFFGSVADNDTGGNSDGFVFTLVDDVDNGTLTFNDDGSFEYTGALNANGPDSFTYRLSDGTQTDTATVRIDVSAVNDRPVLASDAVLAIETSENTQVDGSLAATDVDGDTVTFGLANDAANGTVSVDADGAYTYTPDAGFSGQDSFDLSFTDGTATETETISVTVAPGSTSSLRDDQFTLSEADFVNGAVVDLFANDSGSTQLQSFRTVSVEGASDFGAFPINRSPSINGEVRFTSEQDFSDGQGIFRKIEALDEGQSLTLTYEYTSDASVDINDTGTVTVEIQGVDTAADEERNSVTTLQIQAAGTESGTISWGGTIFNSFGRPLVVDGGPLLLDPDDEYTTVELLSLNVTEDGVPANSGEDYFDNFSNITFENFSYDFSNDIPALDTTLELDMQLEVTDIDGNVRTVDHLFRIDNTAPYGYY